MIVNIVAKSLDEKQKEEFESYLNKKIERVRKLLSHFAEDATLLVATCERFEKHNAFNVEIKLTMPADILIAEESKHTIHEAMDDVVDRLIGQVKKHLEKLRERK